MSSRIKKRYYIEKAKRMPIGLGGMGIYGGGYEQGTSTHYLLTAGGNIICTAGGNRLLWRNR